MRGRCASIPLTHVSSFVDAQKAEALRGAELALVWDATGQRYSHGAGLHVWMDGKWVGSSPPQLPMQLTCSEQSAPPQPGRHTHVPSSQ